MMQEPSKIGFFYWTIRWQSLQSFINPHRREGSEEGVEWRLSIG
jgi:hypothetical protein